jgi:hypothetical protein
MLACIFHKGSGLGDQLHRYITVKTLAQSKGRDFGVVSPGNFKGASFMQLDMGATPPEGMTQWMEKDVRDAEGDDIRSYDPEINFIKDNTLIDGYFEDDKYWRWRLGVITNWLKVEPLEISDNTCVIGFRGGEFSTDPRLFLPLGYWNTAIDLMKSQNPHLTFEVHTDDVERAKAFFPDFPCVHDIGTNWRSIRFARYSIIANSAFYIMPRILAHYHNNKAFTIAPRGWARANIGKWARPACYYPEFLYV